MLKNLIKFNIFFLILFFSTNILSSINPYAEELSGGRVSQELENEIKELLKELHVQEFPQIRKVSNKLVSTYPSTKYGGALFNYFYIEENFYNYLTKNEKKFLLSYLAHSNNYIYREYLPKKAKIINGVSIGTLASLLFISYNLNKHNFSWKSRYPIYFGILALMGNFNIFLTKKILKDGTLNSVPVLAQRFNCIDGAISYLEKREKFDKEFFGNSETKEATQKNLLSLKSLKKASSNT